MNEPISGLDGALDVLVAALTQTPDLAGLIHGLESYGDLLPTVDLDHPAAIDALSVGLVWEALAATAREVQTLKEAAHGDQA